MLTDSRTLCDMVEDCHVQGYYIRLIGQTRYQEARAQLVNLWGKHRPVSQLLWRLRRRMRSLVRAHLKTKIRKSGDVAPGRTHRILGSTTSPIYNNQKKKHHHRQEHSKGKY